MAADDYLVTRPRIAWVHALCAGQGGEQPRAMPWAIPRIQDMLADVAARLPVARWRHDHDLGTAPGTVTSFATGINDSDQVIGWGQDENGNTTNWLWNSGAFRILPMSAGGINDNGAVIGSTQVAAGSFHLMLWNGYAQDTGDIGGSYLVVNGLTSRTRRVATATACLGISISRARSPTSAASSTRPISTPTASTMAMTWSVRARSRSTALAAPGRAPMQPPERDALPRQPDPWRHQQRPGHQRQRRGRSATTPAYGSINHAFLWELGTMFVSMSSSTRAAQRLAI